MVHVIKEACLYQLETFHSGPAPWFHSRGLIAGGNSILGYFRKHMQHWIAEWRQRTNVIHVVESGHGEKDGMKFLVSEGTGCSPANQQHRNRVRDVLFLK